MQNEKKLESVSKYTMRLMFKQKGIKSSQYIGKNIESGKEYIFKGQLFSDCTGDGEIGFLAGADYRMGREM